MTASDLKLLEQVIKLCRKTGVQTIKFDGIEIQLGPETVKYRKPKPAPLEDPLANAEIPVPNIFDPIANAKAAAARATRAIQDKIDMPDELTEEQLLNWSSRPEPFEGQQ